METFLPEYLVMVDCEMTGVIPKRDELLQIAMLKLKLDGIQYVEEGEPLVLYLHTDAQPQSGFQQKYLTHIFEKCNESDLTPQEAQKRVHDWMGKQLLGKVTPCGDCVPTDIAFLKEKGIITESDFENDKPKEGTFHYEFFEMNSIKAVARHMSGAKESLADLDTENIHDALVDCRNQTIEMNHYLKTLLGGGQRSHEALPTANVTAGLKVDYHTILFDLFDCTSEKDYNFRKTQELIPKDAIYHEHPYQTDFRSGLEEVPHTTVLFGLKDEQDFFPIRKYFSEQLPINFQIGKIKAFRNDDKPYDVLVLEINSKDLPKHHWWIRDNFDTHNNFPDYQAHMTLAYIQKGTCKEIEGKHPWMGTGYKCSKVKFSHKDDFRIDIPLGKTKPVHSITLSNKDFDLFVKHLNNPPAPNAKLREAFKKYGSKSKVMAAEIQPATVPGDLPIQPDVLALQKGKALRCDSFQDFQELMNKIMIELQLTEDYRVALAGALNQMRMQEGYIAL